MLLTQLTLAGLATFAGSTPTPPIATTALVRVDEEELSGSIRSVDLENGTFVLVVDEEEHTLSFDDDTTYRLNGEDSTRDDVLQAGTRVQVSHEDGVAKTVSARRAPDRE